MAVQEVLDRDLLRRHRGGAIARSRGARLAAVVAWLALAVVAGASIAEAPTFGRVLLAVSVAVALALRFPALAIAAILAGGAFEGSLRALSDDGLAVRNFVQVSIAGLAIACIGAYLLDRKRRRQLGLGLALLTAYLAVTVAQIPFAETPTVGLQAFRAATLPILLVIAIAVATWRPETQRRIVDLIVLIVAAVAAYGTLRLITGPTGAERDLASLSPYNFVEDKLVLVGSFTSRQELSSWIAVALPFCTALALASRGRRRMLIAGAAALCVPPLIGSQTRTAAVAAVVGLFLVVGIAAASRASTHTRLGTVAAALAATALIAGLSFTFALGGSEGATKRYATIFEPTADRPFEKRLEKWQATLQEINEHPGGLGLGSAGTTQQNYARFLRVSTFDIDNTYLEIAYQQGVAPLLLFAGALVALLLALCRRGLASTDRRTGAVAMGAAGALATWMVLLTTLEQLESADSALLWILVGLGLFRVTGGATEPTAERPSKAAPIPARPREPAPAFGMRARPAPVALQGPAHAPVSPPPAPAAYQAEPVATRARRVWETRVPLALGVLAVLAAGLVGLLAGRAGKPSHETIGQALSVGELVMHQPPGWHRAPVPKLAGLDLDHVTAFTPAGGGAALITGVAHTGAVFPARLAEPVLGGHPAGRAVVLGQFQAVRYAGRSGGRSVVLFVLPTSPGPVVIACSGASDAVSGCERTLGALRPEGAAALPISSLAAYAGTVEHGLARLNRVRLAARRRLFHARTPGGQVAAATALTRAHARAARPLGDPPDAVRGQSRRLVQALRRLSDQYKALASAIRHDNPRRYRRVARLLRRSEAGLRRAVATL